MKIWEQYKNISHVIVHTSGQHNENDLFTIYEVDVNKMEYIPCGMGIVRGKGSNQRIEFPRGMILRKGRTYCLVAGPVINLDEPQRVRVGKKGSKNSQ